MYYAHVRTAAHKSPTQTLHPPFHKAIYSQARDEQPLLGKWALNVSAERDLASQQFAEWEPHIWNER